VDNLNLDFPFCGDLRRDNAIRPLVKQAVKFVVDRIGAPNLEAVILTGSLARGEGSVLLTDGPARLLGDMEFLVILRAPFDWPETRRKCVQLSREGTEGIGRNGSLAKIEYQPAGVVYLQRNIRPSIFAYDLFRYGNVIGGRRDILKEIRTFDTEKIPKEDALNLLMNRFVELMLLADHNQSNCGDPEALQYQLIKTILDIAGSALAFTGRHVPLYAKRKEAFRRLLASDAELQGTIPALETFEEQLEMATHCKLAPTVELLNTTDGWKQRVIPTMEWARALWLWEMRRFLRRPGAEFSELLEGYLCKESFQQRLKGWMKFYLHPLRPPGVLVPARLLRQLLHASPHALTYAAALIAAEGILERENGWERQTVALLPVRVRQGDGTVLRQINDTWSWLTRNN